MLAVSLHNMAYGAAHSWNHRAATGHQFTDSFTETFCRQMFSRRIVPAGNAAIHRLAGSIRTLGRASEAIGDPPRGTALLYRVLWPPERFPHAQELDAIAAEDLSAHRAALECLRWPSPRPKADKFIADTLAEYALAARLDMLSCSRAVLFKQLRAGRTPSTASLKKLIAHTLETTDLLKRVWMLRNKPSRLRDHIRDMGLAITGYRKLLT